jgi:BlaI family transcriptional regulator, penicillinase repressor
MARKKRELSAAEWEIMDVVWMHSDSVTVRDVMQTAYPDDEKAYTTVQTLMNILVGKGVLKKRKHGAAHRYSATVKRDEVLDASMNTIARRMFRGSFGAMASFLVNSNSLSDDDVAALRKIIDTRIKKRCWKH